MWVILTSGPKSGPKTQPPLRDPVMVHSKDAGSAKIGSCWCDVIAIKVCKCSMSTTLPGKHVMSAVDDSQKKLHFNNSELRPFTCNMYISIYISIYIYIDYLHIYTLLNKCNRLQLFVYRYFCPLRKYLKIPSSHRLPRNLPLRPGAILARRPNSKELFVSSRSCDL